MSIEGNSRLAKVTEQKAFVQNQRPSSNLASSSDIQTSQDSINKLREQLGGSDSTTSSTSTTNSSTTQEAGYRNGKFSIRHFLDDKKIGRTAFAEDPAYATDRFNMSTQKVVVDTDALDKKLVTLGELHDKRSELEIKLEAAKDDNKPGIQSQIDDLNSQIMTILKS